MGDAILNRGRKNPVERRGYLKTRGLKRKGGPGKITATGKGQNFNGKGTLKERAHL